MANILVVVDYQNDFVNGSLGFPKAQQLEEGIIKKIEEVGNSGGYIICTMDTHNQDYMKTQEGNKLPIEHCIVGTHGWNMVETVKAVADRYMVKYMHKNTFPSAELLSELRRINALEKTLGDDKPDTIEFCGVVTDICVISNVVIAKAALPEAKIIVHSDLCASNNDEMHNMALQVMKSIQVEVI